MCVCVCADIYTHIDKQTPPALTGPFCKHLYTATPSHLFRQAVLVVGVRGRLESQVDGPAEVECGSMLSGNPSRAQALPSKRYKATTADRKASALATSEAVPHRGDVITPCSQGCRDNPHRKSEKPIDEK